MDWLGRWEPPYYWGKHEQRIPVTDGQPYPVIRAIPVDGIVGPTWMQSPQARFWLDETRPSVWKRILTWLNK